MREPHPVPGPLPRPADDDRRVRPQRAGPGQGQLHRVRPGYPAPGDRPHGHPARRHRDGRHDAARRLRGRAAARLPGGPGLRQGRGLRAAPAPLREFNPRYRGKFEGTGFVCSGESPDGRLVEFIELDNHRSGSARRRTPSSPAGPTGRGRCSASSSVRRSTAPRGSPAAPVPRRRTPVRPRLVNAAAGGEAAGSASSTTRRSGSASASGPVKCGWPRPGGSVLRRETVHHPGAVGVVPLHDDGTVASVRQYQVSVDAELWEVPAGLRDVEGEPPAETASRELVEEAGLEASWSSSCRSTARRASPTSVVYLATGLAPVPDDRQGVEEAHGGSTACRSTRPWP